MMTQGAFPLTGVKNLPHVSVAYGPGAEHWSNRKASGAITPGVAVVPVPDTSGSAHVNTPGNELKMRVATASDSALQLAIALKTVQVPDPNTGPNALGPTEIMNQDIADGEYVHAYYQGSFWITLVTPGTYAAADRIGWDADGVRPAGISGVGAWARNASADIDDVFEVMEVRRIGSANEVMLGVRFLRGS